MGRSDRLWRFPLTAKLHHTCEGKSERTVDEELVKKFLSRNGEHVVVDLGIGTGRELGWLREIPSASRIIGVDYSTHMLGEGMKRWKGFEKKLMLVDDDMTKLANLSAIVREESKPCYYVSLANTLGNLEADERVRALGKIASIMKREDRLLLSLYKLPDSKHARSKELEYYRKNFPIYERIVWEMFHKPIHYAYDEKEENVVFGTKDEPVCISHRWSKKEIGEVCAEAGLSIERLEVGKYAYIPICRLKED